MTVRKQEKNQTMLKQKLENTMEAAPKQTMQQRGGFREENKNSEITIENFRWTILTLIEENVLQVFNVFSTKWGTVGWKWLKIMTLWCRMFVLKTCQEKILEYFVMILNKLQLLVEKWA